MATPEVHQLTLYGRDGAGNQWNCVLHYVLSSSGVWSGQPIARSIALIDQWVAHIQDLWLAAMPLGYVLDIITAKRVTPGVGFTATKVATAAATAATEASSLVQGPLLRWIPNDPYPKTGRTFFPGIPEDKVTDGNIIAGWITGTLQPLCSAMVTTMVFTAPVDTGNCDLCVYNRHTHANGVITTYDIAHKLGVLPKRLKPVY